MTLLLFFLTFHPVPGEKIFMDVYFGPVKAGKLTLEVAPDVEVVNNISCYHLKLKLRTTGVFSTFFKVDDEIQSFVDTATLHTIRYFKRLREGKYRAKSSVTYSVRDSLAVYPDTVIKTPPFYDPLSLVYIARSVGDGDTIKALYHVDKITTTALIFTEGKERLNGLVAQKISIDFKEKGLFKNGGTFLMWISQNSGWREPLKIQSRLKFGSLIGVLSRYIPGKSR